MKRFVRMILTASAAALTTLALFPPARFVIEPDVSAALQDFGVGRAVLACFLCVFYKKTLFSGGWKPARVSTLVFSLALSACILLGASFQAYDSWDLWRLDPQRAFMSVLAFFGYSPFFYALIEAAFAWAERARACEAHKQSGAPERVQFAQCDGSLSQRAGAFLLERRPFLTPFAVFMLAWLPYWLMCFPGTMQPDSIWQLSMYFGYTDWTSIHPIFSTLLLGWPMHLSRILLNDTFGLFLCALLQQLLMASVCAYVMKTIKEWGAPRRVRLCALGFFALHPIIAFAAQAVSKDSISAAVLLLFGVLYLELIRSIKLGRPLGPRLAAAIAAAVLASLLRSNNLYIAAPALAALVFNKQRLKWRLLCFCAALLCFFSARAVSRALEASLNVRPVSVAEALSIPFQQTARYLRDYGGDVTPEEREAIDAVLDYEALPELYNPELSDPVKFTYKGENKALPAYFEAWLAMFLRHPGAYFQASINNSYVYFCPDVESDIRPMVYNDVYEDPYFNINGAPVSLRRAAYKGMIAIKEIPVVGVLFSIGGITWLLLFFALWLGRIKKRGHIMGFVPALMTLLTCIASPVNGYWRYYTPILLMLPLLFVWTAHASSEDGPLNQSVDELIPLPRQ